MADLLEQCIEDLSAPGSQKDYKAFQATFCDRCRNPECLHAKWADDKFGARVATQVDRFFNAPQADNKDPRFAMIGDFEDCYREAVRLEAADRAGDWEVPEVDISDGQPQVSKPTVTDHVDDAVRKLAEVKGKGEPDLPDPHEAAAQEFVEETEALMVEEERPPPPEPESTPEPPVLEQPRQFVGHMNTPVPERGILIGDGPAPQHPAKTTEDAWAPKPGAKTVSPGATVKMGGGEDDE